MTVVARRVVPGRGRRPTSAVAAARRHGCAGRAGGTEQRHAARRERPATSSCAPARTRTIAVARRAARRPIPRGARRVPARHVQPALPRTCVDRAELRDRLLDGRTGHCRGLVATARASSGCAGHRRRRSAWNRRGPGPARGERRLLRPQRRRRRRLRRRPARPGRARAAGQVLWSRQDELTWAPFALRDDGRRLGHRRRRRPALVLALRRLQPGPHRAAGVRRRARPARRDHARRSPATTPPPTTRRPPPGTGAPATRCPVYDLPRRRVIGHRLLDTPIRSPRRCGRWARTSTSSPSSPSSTSPRERAGRDPLEFRLRHLSDPRGRRVLEPAATAAPAGDAPPPDGTGRGIGYARYKGRGAFCAVVAEVEAETDVGYAGSPSRSTSAGW